MRMSNFLDESFTIYKIEKWNEKKSCWEFYRGFFTYSVAKHFYKIILENNKGIFRLLKVIELGGRDTNV